MGKWLISCAVECTGLRLSFWKMKMFKEMNLKFQKKSKPVKVQFLPKKIHYKVTLQTSIAAVSYTVSSISLQTTIQLIQHYSHLSRGSNATFWFGHYPTSTIVSPGYDLRAFIGWVPELSFSIWVIIPKESWDEFVNRSQKRRWDWSTRYTGKDSHKLSYVCTEF